MLYFLFGLSTQPAPSPPDDSIIFGFSGTELATILVGIVAALSAWAAQRSAAKASQANVSQTTRADIEREAFTRAESFLDGTIRRQDAEIVDLRKDVDELRVDNGKLHRELEAERRSKAELARQLDECKAENLAQARQIEYLSDEVAQLRVGRGIQNTLDPVVSSEDLDPPGP